MVTSRFHTIGFGSRLKRIERFADGTGISTFYVVISGTGSQDISDADLANLSDLLRWPRGCQRGLKQKRSFLLQGISEGLFSTTWPYLPGGLRAYNFCAASRCQINEEAFKRYQEEHRTETAASSSTTAPSETTVSRRVVWCGSCQVVWKPTCGITISGVRTPFWFWKTSDLIRPNWHSSITTRFLIEHQVGT